MIDLHIHSIFSDGILTPKEIVEHSAKNKISVISITDHDTTDGIKQAIESGSEAGVEVVPGIEISAEYKNVAEREIHILGYFIDYNNEELQQKLFLFRKARIQRAKEILSKLSKLKIFIDFDHLIKNRTNDFSVGRMHIARAMLENKYITNIREAFEKYLAWGRPAYVPKIMLNTKEAILLIKKINGVAILAHPRYGTNINKKILNSLKLEGIDGIEIYHPKHSQEVTKFYEAFVKENNLIPTGGSDCHGSCNGEEVLIGKFNINYEIFENLKKRRNERLEHMNKIF